MSTIVPVLSIREIGGGTDPDSGLPMIDLQGLRSRGIDVPDVRLKIDPDAAVRVGVQLIAAARPELMLELIEEVVTTRAEERARKAGPVLEHSIARPDDEQPARESGGAS